MGAGEAQSRDPAGRAPRSNGTAECRAGVASGASRSRPHRTSDVTLSGRVTAGPRRPDAGPARTRVDPQPSFPASRVGH